MQVESEVVLDAPIGRAWEILMRWEDQARWMKDADSVTVTSPHREGIGVRLAVKTRVLNVPLFTEQLEVVAWEPPTRLLMAHRSFIGGVGEWAFAEVDAGRTRFTWREDISLPVPILGELALQVYKPFMRWLMRGALDGLQRFVRSGAA
ncbi:MAG: SRPBCC family protein [Actinomycetota bacterium]